MSCVETSRAERLASSSVSCLCLLRFGLPVLLVIHPASRIPDLGQSMLQPLPVGLVFLFAHSPGALGHTKQAVIALKLQRPMCRASKPCGCEREQLASLRRADWLPTPLDPAHLEAPKRPLPTHGSSQALSVCLAEHKCNEPSGRNSGPLCSKPTDRLQWLALFGESGESGESTQGVDSTHPSIQASTLSTARPGHFGNLFEPFRRGVMPDAVELGLCARVSSHRIYMFAARAIACPKFYGSNLGPAILAPSSKISLTII